MERFESRGVKLAGLLEGPEDGPIVIFVHGFVSSKESSTITTLCPILHKEGVATFRFDLMGHGDSEGKFAEITPSAGVQNTLDAIAFVKSKGFDTIGLMGSSFGGYAAYRAAEETDVRALVCKCPVADFAEKGVSSSVEDDDETWEKNGHTQYKLLDGSTLKLNYSFAEDAKNASAYATAKNIGAPTLIIHGDKDTIVPIDQSRKMASLIPHCMLATIDGAEHWFQDETFDKMIQLASSFLIEQVR